MKRPIPNGDILIHAGDFTRCGNMKEVRVQERVVVRGDTYMTSALSGGHTCALRTVKVGAQRIAGLCK